MLEIDDLSIAFQTERGLVSAVDHFTLNLQEGEVLGLVGESGCGKTLVSLAIMNLLPQAARVTSGAVRFHGRDLLRGQGSELNQIRGKRIAMIFQDPMASLDPVFTCGQQIVEAILLHQAVGKAEARDRAAALLERVRIKDPRRCMDAYPHELSGGMCQRVMIAMALICEPEVIVADEPTTALDVTVQAQVLGLLRELHQNSRTSILLITHDLGVIYQLAERVAVMYAGTLMEVAETRTLFADPLNPYTQALIDSVPAIGRGRGRLAAIEGRVPALGERPLGCRFSDRCGHADARCRAEQPPLAEFRCDAGGSLVSCWKAGQVI